MWTRSPTPFIGFKWVRQWQTGHAEGECWPNTDWSPPATCQWLTNTEKSEITWQDPKNYSIVSKMKQRCRKAACGATASPTGRAENCNLLKSIRGKYRWETFGCLTWRKWWHHSVSHHVIYDRDFKAFLSQCVFPPPANESMTLPQSGLFIKLWCP